MFLFIRNGYGNMHLLIINYTFIFLMRLVVEPYLSADAKNKLNKTIEQCSNKELRLLQMESIINTDLR